MAASSFETLSRALAALIRERRESADLSQEEVAHRAGMSVRHYGQLESGRGNPTLRTLWALAAVLDEDLSDLIRRAGRGVPKTRR